MTVRVFDKHGVERSWDWLVAEFGPLQVLGKSSDSGWALVELREIDDLKQNALMPKTGIIEAPATIIATMLDVNGNPAANVPVSFYWPDAPERPDCGGFNRCVVGLTNDEGKVGFAMGGGAYYWPPNIGPHATWVCGENSDVCNGLGMLGGTNHRHVDPTYQWVNPDEPPPPPPPGGDCPWGEIEQYLGLIERAVAGIRGLRGADSEAPFEPHP